MVMRFSLRQIEQCLLALPRSAGVLAAGRTGGTELVSGVRGAQLIGVTREPAGGSRTPTLPLVAELPLT